MNDNKHLNTFIGTLKPKEVTLVAGVPGSGKTLLALSVAMQCGIREKKNVVIFSIEMLRENIVKGLLSMLAGVSMEKMFLDNLSRQEREKLLIASEALHKSKIFIDDESRTTPISILKKCREFEQTTGKIDLIMIDYLELMLRGDWNTYSRKEEILLIIDDLKKVAAELNVAILALKQCNRRIGERVSCERWLPKDIQPLWLLLGQSDLSDKRLEAERGRNAHTLIPLEQDKTTGRIWEV